MLVNKEFIRITHPVRLIGPLIVALAVYYPASAQSRPSLTARITTKPVEQFGKCFVDTQERASRPWWFVPSASGGTFSNAGATSSREENAYFLRVQRSSDQVVTRLLLEGGSRHTRREVTAAIEACG